MDKGVSVGTSLLPPGSTTLWKKSAISRWRRPSTVGGQTSPYVDKGANRGFATRPRWENENILRTQDGGRLTRPFQLVIPLEVDQCWEDVEDDKL